MKDDIQGYLATLVVPQPIVERVQGAVRAFDFLCGGASKKNNKEDVEEEPETVERVFLCNGATEHGDHSYLSCWGFSPTFWFEARNFLTTYNADISPYVDSIWYLGLDYRDFQLGGPIVESSALTVDVATGRLDSNKLSATGANCRFLLDIVDEVFLPNVRISLL